MNFIVGNDELISSISLYKNIHWIYHGHVLPFLFLYSSWLYVWTFIYGTTKYFEAGLIVLTFLGLLHILLLLSCHWSIDVLAFMTCRKVHSIQEASIAKVRPNPNNGASELVRVHKSKNDIWLSFQKLKYIWNSDKKIFSGLEFPLNHSFSYYLESKGHESDEDCSRTEEFFGNNGVDMTIPSFKELFIERSTAPFFVFQVFCVGLWCLDEYWIYSVFTLVMLILFECTLVNQQLRNMSEIRNMGNKPFLIQVYRSRRWRSISSTELLTGDIVSLGRSSYQIPCDLLLLRGPCIVDESMLTGESVPQMKEAIENIVSDRFLSISSDQKLHVLFGGTKIVQHTAPSKTSDLLRSPENGCIAYVLKTGFNTSQGKLLRTILFGVRRVTANNLETFGFILFLLFFAILASSYVWIKGTENPDRNRYKLFLECTLILTSVVPPELPIELSLAVNTSLLSLSRLSVYCTEPFRIPFGGKIDICCFDKTGTLTSDDLRVDGVVGVSETDKESLTPISEIPSSTLQILATCHSLVMMDEGLVGDPLEKSVLKAIDWSLTKGDAVIPKRGKMPALKIFQRHHFSSSLKRMSVIAGYNLEPGTSATTHILTVKGAPETIQGMLSVVPENYEALYLQMCIRGSRVLALAFKDLGSLNHHQVKELSREELERDLTFAGFLIISCPLKADSKAVIREIATASHGLVMITGDSALTAIHVAQDLGFLRFKNILTLCPVIGSLDSYEWKSSDSSLVFPLTTSKEISQFHDLCLTGDSLSFLHRNHYSLYKKLLPFISVFARVSPKEKELIITSLRELGFFTLMVGDGTNDVGALKHSHVGVAILSSGVSDSKRERGPLKTLDFESSKTSESLKGGKRESGKLKKILKELEEAESESQFVKLGDASIAAPFTAKSSSISSVTHIIKQGRCTLVTTLQMFKILALNALILAYSQSVLYLEGVKFSDGQATLQGILLSACFLFISRSKPLKVLSKERPLPSIFNVYTLMTVLLQFGVHFGCLLYLVDLAYLMEPKTEEFPNLEKEFTPSLLNSAVYMISITLQVSTFAINYRGRPYMESLRENKALLTSLLATASFIALLALGWLPELSQQFGIIDFPPQFRSTLLCVLGIDFCFSFLLDRICLFLFGEGKLRIRDRDF